MYAYTQEDGSTKFQVKMENETVLVEYKPDGGTLW